MDALSIVLIDLLLAGDNALIIALAVRALPPRERRLGIVTGAAGAVALRVAVTIVAAQLLTISFLKLAGGLFVLWIAVKVFADAGSPEDAPQKAPHRFLRAIGYILFADITMSVDNVLAVAGASRGNAWLIAFGLALSIPFVVASSGLLSKLMDRFPWVLYGGAAILGKVGAEMVLTDPFLEARLHPSADMLHAGETLGAIAVLVAALLMSRRARRVTPA